MKIITTSQEIINKVESSDSGLPIAVLVTEALVEVEKDGKVVKFRLREFDNNAKKAHLKIMKTISGNRNYSQEEQDKLDNLGRAFTLNDLSDKERTELNSLYNEVFDYFGS